MHRIDRPRPTQGLGAHMIPGLASSKAKESLGRVRPAALALALMMACSPAVAATDTGVATGGTGASASTDSQNLPASFAGGSAGINGPTAGDGPNAGAAGASPGASGGAATTPENNPTGAGGGGGGANGASSISASPVSGGSGGAGTGTVSGSGGGGGGIGVVAQNVGGALTVGATITGGAGGAGGKINGGNGSFGGGGGGGGGDALYLTTTVNTTLTVDAALTGGNGGHGGNSGSGGAGTTSGAGGSSSGAGGAAVSGANGSGGGGGGGGGGGLYVGAAAGVTTTVINNASITGGNGGQGGSSLGFPNGNGGNAGGGGVGVNLDGDGITLVNAGTISGGNGGVGGQVNTQFGTPFGVNGLSGDGGVAVTANGGSTIINSGTITGGASGYGYRADAIDLSGGANTVVIEAGSQIVGNVVSSSGNSNGGDHLALGGDVDALGGNVFDASQLGTQYQGFSGYTKTGTSTWTLTGTSASPSTAWNLAEGTLAIASGTSLGSGTLTFSGGTLDVTGSTSLGQSLVASGGPANILLDNNATLTLGGVISGTGSVVQRGNGTLSLTGSNTYTGGTDVQSGTLSVGSSTALGVGDVSFADGTRWLLAGNGIDIGNRVDLSGHVAVDVAAGTSDSLGGAISDGNQAGALTKTGTGTLVLSGVNGYTGETTISGGVLQLGNGGTTGSLAGNVVDNATLSLNRSDDLTLTNDISGAGALIQRGSGTVTLAGNNSYAGGTVVQSGGLGVTSDASLGTGNVSLADGTHLVFSGSGIDVGNQVRIAGHVSVDVTAGTSDSLSGSVNDDNQAGMLTKTGGGTLVLQGANGYTGGTTISGGVLQLGSGGVTGSVMGNIVDNATLALDRSDDVTLSNNITGSGTLLQRGSGTLTLTGSNSYTGGTVVQSGGLGVASAGSLGTGSVTIADGARFVFNGSGIGLGNQVLIAGHGAVDVAAGASDTLNGAIGDGAQAGTLTKTGAGTLILNGSNDYTGGTNITLGTLEVGGSDHANASIMGPVSVGADGTLRGHGRIDGDVVSDGVVWPGASIGTLTINGNYTQRGDGRLIVDVSPTDASQLVVSGKATLGGSLQVVFAPGTYTSRDIALIKAASVDGTFADVSYSGAVPTGQAVTYDANQVNLYVALASVAPLDASLFGNLMRAQNLAGQQVLDTTLDVSGQLATCNGAASSADGPARDCRSGAWAQYSGGGISLSGDERLNSSAFGVLAGYDIAVGDAFHIGVEGGYNRINGSDNQGGSGHVNSTHGGLYAFADAGPLVISGSVDQTHSRYAFQRQSGAGVEASRPGGSTTSAGVRVAWPVQAGNWTIAPSIGALYQHQSMDSFSESTSGTSALAAAFVLSGTRSHFDSLQPFARLRLGHDFEAAGVHYSAAWDLGYAYAARHDDTPTVDVITQDGSLFTVAGQPIGKGMATVGARISAQVGASWSAYAAYQGQFARHADNQALTVGLRKAF